MTEYNSKYPSLDIFLYCIIVLQKNAIGEGNQWIYILFVPVFIEPNKVKTREEREKEKDIAL